MSMGSRGSSAGGGANAGRTDPAAPAHVSTAREPDPEVEYVQRMMDQIGRQHVTVPEAHVPVTDGHAKASYATDAVLRKNGSDTLPSDPAVVVRYPGTTTVTPSRLDRLGARCRRFLRGYRAVVAAALATGVIAWAMLIALRDRPSLPTGGAEVSSPVPAAPTVAPPTTNRVFATPALATHDSIGPTSPAAPVTQEPMGELKAPRRSEKTVDRSNRPSVKHAEPSNEATPAESKDSTASTLPSIPQPSPAPSSSGNLFGPFHF